MGTAVGTGVPAASTGVGVCSAEPCIAGGGGVAAVRLTATNCCWGASCTCTKSLPDSWPESVPC